MGADGHEGRGFNVAVGGVDDTGATERTGDGFFNFKEWFLDGEGHIM